jgi:hypothetical protein
VSQAQPVKSGRFAISGILFVAALIAGASGTFAADGCPTSASEISTDRPDVTNSSRVVPYGSLQAENGLDWSVRQGSNIVSGSETRLRLGVAQCTGIGRRADVLLLPQRPGVVRIFRLRCLHQEGTARSLRPSFICNRRFGIPDRRQQNFKPRLRSLRSIPMVATPQRRLVTPRYVHCHIFHESAHR